MTPSGWLPDSVRLKSGQAFLVFPLFFCQIFGWEAGGNFTQGDMMNLRIAVALLLIAFCFAIRLY